MKEIITEKEKFKLADVEYDRILFAFDNDHIVSELLTDDCDEDEDSVSVWMEDNSECGIISYTDKVCYECGIPQNFSIDKWKNFLLYYIQDFDDESRLCISSVFYE